MHVRNALGIVALAIAVSSCGAGSGRVDCGRPMAMRESWRSAVAADNESGRRRVAAYVVRCQALRGKTRRVVRDTFGRPVATDEHGLYFYLGPDDLRMDSENLAITFDSDNTVSGAEVVQF
jgi:hypothetical protein